MFSIDQIHEPPYYKEDLPELDRLHYASGLGPEWMESDERALLDQLPKPPEGSLVCAYPGRCTKYISNDRWSKTKAERWLQLKTGEVYCPDHVPAWYAKWRERKKV